MLKRDYTILITAALLLIAGIAVSLVWVGSLRSQFLQENAFLEPTLLQPFDFTESTFQVSNTDANVSLYVHADFGSANITNLTFNVTDSDGRLVIPNKVYENIYMFEPNVTGNYTMLLLNLGPNPVSVDGVFGYIPFINKENNVDPYRLNGIIVGTFLITIGIITLIVGIILTILDRGKQLARLTH